MQIEEDPNFSSLVQKFFKATLIANLLFLICVGKPRFSILIIILIMIFMRNFYPPLKNLEERLYRILVFPHTVWFINGLLSLLVFICLLWPWGIIFLLASFFGLSPIDVLRKANSILGWSWT
jgi:hypothetical protein